MRSLPPVIYLLGIICFLSYNGRHASFPLDDAWIHRVYARAFAAGHGFEYNDGAQEAGATSPLWVIATAPAHWLEPFGRRAVVFGVKGIAILFGVISILLFHAVAKHVTKSTATAVVAASLMALEPRLLFSSLSGMETPLLIALWMGGIYAFLKKKWLLAAVLFGLTPVTRPESLVLLPICAAAGVVYAAGYPLWKKGLASLILALPFLLWAVFCKHTTGHWLPNTHYLKSHPFQLTPKALADAWQVVSSDGFASLFIFLVGVIVCALYLIGRRDVPTFGLMIVGPLVYLLGVAGTRQIFTEGYYWTRWFDPGSLLLTAAFALGYSVLLTGRFELSRLGASAARRVRVVVVAAAAVGLLVCVPAFTGSFKDRRGHLITDSRAIDRINVEAGLWINEHTPPGATIGVNDAGAIRYFGNRHTIDLLGLNNQDIAFRRMSSLDALIRSDWLAIFPSVFRDQQGLIERYFLPVTVFQIPLEEYTICNCPGQTTKVIFRKKSLGDAVRPGS
ncbi:MAG: hypothetical protein P8181_05575 [bacterium]